MQSAPHSTKIAERFTFEDDKIIIKRTHDASHMLKDAQQARELTENSFGSDYKLAGVVDMALLNVCLYNGGLHAAVVASCLPLRESWCVFTMVVCMPLLWPVVYP